MVWRAVKLATGRFHFFHRSSGSLGSLGSPGVLGVPEFWESRESRSPKSCTLPDVYSTKVNEQLTYVSKKQVSKISLSLLITKTTATLFLERYSR